MSLGNKVRALRKVVVVVLMWSLLWPMTGAAALPALAQGAGGADAAAKPRLAVLGVTSPVFSRSSAFPEYVLNLITHDVTTMGRFDVVERSHIDAVLREQRFQLSGAIDPATAVEVGRILGVDIGIIASVEVLEARRVETWYRAEAVTMVRLIDMQTGRLISTLRVEGSATGDTSLEAQRKALDHGFGSRFRNRLASVFSFQGSVIEVHGEGLKGDTVFISVGRSHGVQVGAEFEVKRPEVTTLAGMQLPEGDYFMRTVAAIRVTDTSSEFSRATVVRADDRVLEGDTVVELVPAKSPEEKSETLLYVLTALLVAVLLLNYGGDAAD